MYYFRRANYSQYYKKIYPKFWRIAVLVIEMCVAILIAYFNKVEENELGTIVGIVFFYIIAFLEFFFRYLMKKKYFSLGYEMGKNTSYYFEKSRMLLWINLLVAIACNFNIAYKVLVLKTYSIYDIYWIWCGIIVFLLVFEPFLDITTGFNDHMLLSDRVIVDLNKVDNMRVTKERTSFKGTVYEVEVYADGEKIGLDRFFEEDYMRLKEKLMRKMDYS